MPDFGLAPPPVHSEGKLVVPADFHSLLASVRFDVAARVAIVNASVELSILGAGGWPAFDLRQDIAAARFDGKDLPVDALAPRDMGAGYEARMRAVEVGCDAGSRHRLELSYELRTPQATGAVEVGWLGAGEAGVAGESGEAGESSESGEAGEAGESSESGEAGDNGERPEADNGATDREGGAGERDGVRWDLWMSDLEPGRYLEMWFPANLCHDRLSIELDVEVSGTERPHILLANGTVVERAAGRRWHVRYPASFTSLSPMLVLFPAEELALQQVQVAAGGRHLLVTVAGPSAGVDLGAAVADTAAWLGYFRARYGPWAHGDSFLGVLWAAPRGMEYDGATTASPAALEHEVFHSWFGRGVKPARASDGWMDEAMATWATSSGSGARHRVEELGLDEEPVLLCPPHPWSRHTPREAYPAGSRLLAGLAHMAGGAGALRSALADWHHNYAGEFASSADLARHMARWCGRDLRPWWDRYVYGRG